MKRSPRLINIVLFAACFMMLLSSLSLAEFTEQEKQKIWDAAPSKAPAKPQKPRQLLVFTLCGEKGFKHSSIPYCTEALKAIGEKTGAFTVVESADMVMFQPENLNKFDAVCFNNTTRLEFEDPALRKSLMDFVKGGKGIVGIHAASDNFYTWPEAAEMMGNLFDGHPWRNKGTWAFKLDEPDNPINASFQGKGFKLSDEIYRTKTPPYSRTTLRVILSMDLTDEATASVKDLRETDKDIGISWIRDFGKGRVFYCSFGHNHDLFWNTAVLEHYLAGIQFALGDLDVDATSSVDHALSEIAKYNYGSDRSALVNLTEYIRNAGASADDMKAYELKLIEFLKSDATDAGKQFICRKVSLIGTDKSVPVLSSMLLDAKTSDMARYALERIPGEAASKALRDAMGSSDSMIKIGIINSLGMRGDVASVPALGGLIDSPDAEISEAAIAALGHIGTPQAAQLLNASLAKASGDKRTAILHAYLKCADKLIAAGANNDALAIYKRLYVPSEAAPIRTAALRGMVKGLDTAEMIGILKGDDQAAIQTVAMELMSDTSGKKGKRLMAVLSQLPDYSNAGQVQLLTSMSNLKGFSGVLPTVVNAAESRNEAVKLAAIRTLSTVGDASTVPMLAKLAAGRRGTEQLAAAESLNRLNAPNVDETIIETIASAKPAEKIVLIKSVVERRIISATPTLIASATDKDRKVRVESFRALREVAPSESLGQIVDLAINAKSGNEQNEAEKAAAAVAKRIGDGKSRTEVVLKALSSASDAKAKCSLIRILGRIGDESGQSVIVAGLTDSNKEIRDNSVSALETWPSPSPADDLLKVAQGSSSKRNKVLALRGYINMAGMVSSTSPEKALEMYKTAMSLATRNDERVLVLGSLTRVRLPEALDFVIPYLDNKDLREEAKATCTALAVAVRPLDPAKADAALDKLASISDRKETIVRKGEDTILTADMGILTAPMTLETGPDGVMYMIVPNGLGFESVGFDEGGRAIFRFSTAEEGTLEMSYLLNCPDNGNDSWHIKLDDKDIVTWNDLITKGWQWMKFSRSYNVEKGKHLLIVNQREDGGKISQIKLTLK